MSLVPRGQDSVLAFVGLSMIAGFVLPTLATYKALSLREELSRHLFIAVPTILRYLCFTLSDCFFIAMVGHYDSTPVSHFAGVNMGVMLVNVTGLSLGIGFAGALGPFVAQEYGTGYVKRSGLHLMNFAKCATLIFIFSFFTTLHSKEVLTRLGQDPEVATCVQRYARIAVWALPGQMAMKGLQQVLDAQRDVGPGLMADAAGAVIQISLSWYALSSGAGFKGAAQVKVCSSSLVCCLFVAWIKLTGRGSRVWSSPANEPPADLSPFLRQAVPNTFATVVEWWAQELMALLAGLLPNPSMMVGANGVLFTCASLFYMVWVGSKNAMATRVGNLIGSGQPDKVPQAIAVGIVVCAVEVIAVVSLGTRYQSEIIALFTTNAELQHAVAQSWCTMLFVLVPYSFTFVIFGVLSGAGRQGIVAYVFLVSLTVGMPVGICLSFGVKLGLDGVWLGNGAFFAIAGGVLNIKVFQSDWPSMKTLEDYVQIKEVLGA